jgi:glutamate synthase domain-containing protein 2
MAIYKCQVCDYLYDEDKEGVKWEDLPDDWVCPVCESDKSLFEGVKDIESESKPVETTAIGDKSSIEDLIRNSDQTETLMADIHMMAETGQSVLEPMKTKLPVISWDDILIKGAQLAKIPLNHEDPVSAQTVIGPKAKKPLRIESPIYVSHMSFGALSKEAKLALAKGSAAAKTAMCSGEGGIIPESMESAYKYIFEYVPNKYSVTDENLKRADAIELKIGQSAKPGMGGHLPGDKVTEEIASVRGFKPGVDIVSPSHFADIQNKDDLKKTVEMLRDRSEGKPIGIKIAAGNIESDLNVVLFAKPDFVTIDGRAGATAAAPKFVKAATSVPTLFALYRTRKFLDDSGAKNISLIITGGLRISSDFAKALALGADAVAIATTALMAIGCQQYRICHTGKCPMGIATQNPDLRERLDIETSANQLANFLTATTEELKTFARLTGNNDIHKLSVDDLCTTNSEISGHTNIEHV